MSEHPKPCRWVDNEHPRALRTHLRDCMASGCEGCEPCPEKHCLICGKTHTDQLRCGSCVGDVRDDLGLILRLEDHLLTEAAHRGIESEAMMLLGPAADYQTWRQIRTATINRLTCQCADCPALNDGDDWKPCPDVLAFTEDNRDEPHPTWVIGQWSLLVSEHYEQDQTLRVTTKSAVHHLRANLTDLAREAEFPFEELASEVRACRGHLEDVLHDGDRDEKGAPCPMCGKKDLVKVWAACGCEGEACDKDCECEAGTLSAECDSADRWTCPRKDCSAAYTEDDYRVKVEAVYVLHADRLTASQISVTYRVPEGTIRQWALREKVRKHGTDTQGRMLYDVADVINARDAIPA